MKNSLCRLFILLMFPLLTVNCGDDDDMECSRDMSDEDINVFSWANFQYDVSENSSRNFVICTEGEVDAFWNANNANEVTFGFRAISSPVTIALDGESLPSPEIILTQGNATYVATSGEVTPCEGGYDFSLTMTRVTNPNDLSTTQGAGFPLTGFLKCP